MLLAVCVKLVCVKLVCVKFSIRTWFISMLYYQSDSIHPEWHWSMCACIVAWLSKLLWSLNCVSQPEAKQYHKWPWVSLTPTALGRLIQCGCSFLIFSMTSPNSFDACACTAFLWARFPGSVANFLKQIPHEGICVYLLRWFVSATTIFENAVPLLDNYYCTLSLELEKTFDAM